MQDIAREITALLEPSEPLGYRLVIFCDHCLSANVIFEAKGVPFKGGVGFLVRCVSPVKFRDCAIPPIAEMPTQFAPTVEALKFLIRMVYNLQGSSAVTLMPPGYTGYSRVGQYGCQDVNLGVDLLYNRFEVGEVDSFQERALSEAVAALTVMSVPEGLK